MTPDVFSANESLYDNLMKFLDYRVLGVIFLIFCYCYISLLAIFMPTLVYFSFVFTVAIFLLI